MSVCRHFGLCGGCALQHLPPQAYRAAKKTIVTAALARAGLNRMTVEDPLVVPPASRRRAVFKIARKGETVEIGFHAARSHTIVDMHECLVLTPALFALVQDLRGALAPLLHPGEKCELHATEADNGLDLAMRWGRKLTPALTAAIAQALAGKNIARVIFNGAVLTENAPPAVTWGAASVALPPHAFLQATREGEAALREKVVALAKGAKIVADLFAGLGTFTLPLARHAQVHAVEQDGTALAALAAAGRAAHRFGAGGLKPITTEKRDLFKLPLSPAELNRYDAVVLDPPRAGAEAQIRALAASKVPRLAYVSCDAASFARDAALLTAAGFVPGPVTPIDQFLFSGHIELVATFRRGRAR